MELEGIFLILAFASLSKGILLQLPTLWSAIRFILVFPLHIGVYFTLKLLTYFPLIMQDLDLTFSRTREYKFLAVSGGILLEVGTGSYSNEVEYKEQGYFCCVLFSRSGWGDYKSKTEEERTSVQGGTLHPGIDFDLPAVLYLSLQFSTADSISQLLKSLN